VTRPRLPITSVFFEESPGRQFLCYFGSYLRLAWTRALQKTGFWHGVCVGAVGMKMLNELGEIKSLDKPASNMHTILHEDHTEY